jgi:hypothetical protein
MWESLRRPEVPHPLPHPDSEAFQQTWVSHTLTPSFPLRHCTHAVLSSPGGRHCAAGPGLALPAPGCSQRDCAPQECVAAPVLWSATFLLQGARQYVDVMMWIHEPMLHARGTLCFMRPLICLRPATTSKHIRCCSSSTTALPDAAVGDSW